MSKWETRQLMGIMFKIFDTSIGIFCIWHLLCILLLAGVWSSLICAAKAHLWLIDNVDCCWLKLFPLWNLLGMILSTKFLLLYSEALDTRLKHWYLRWELVTVVNWIDNCGFFKWGIWCVAQPGPTTHMMVRFKSGGDQICAMAFYVLWLAHAPCSGDALY